MFFPKLALLASFLCVLLPADTVVLASGDAIEGHLLSADEYTIRIRDTRGIVEEIPRERVVTLRFSATSGSALKQETAVPPGPPENQQQFCALVTQFQQEAMAYMQEPNPIRKAGMRAPDPYRYEPQIRTLFGPDHKFVNWTGSLTFGTTGHSVAIIFTPACDPPNPIVQFANTTEQPGIPVQDRASVIRTDSPLAQTLASAKQGNQQATVSGSLVPLSGLSRFTQALSGVPNASAGRALFRSLLNPSGASLAQPSYLVEFTSVHLTEAHTQK